LDYIFYKEDLYGYSVFEVDSKKSFNYYPAATYKKQIETFIGTDIHYNKNNNVFAVGGCYWACPGDVFLIKINNPMEQFTGIINIHEIIDPGYEKYDDIDFEKWENNDIKLKIEDNQQPRPEGQGMLFSKGGYTQGFNTFLTAMNGGVLNPIGTNKIITLTEKEYMDKMITV
jgi:hypothetical protein